MKKMLAILMALLMAALLLPAYAEEGDVAEIAEIAGTVLEIGEESILLETPEGVISIVCNMLYHFFANAHK